MNNRALRKLLPFLLLLLLAGIALYLRRDEGAPAGTKTSPVATGTAPGKTGLNRNPAVIRYTKHARCRMDCRHISEAEVREILASGKINYRKSDLKQDDCHKRYAVEGHSSDRQRLRIIFAPCGNQLTVVTVIDLDTDWSCDCK